MKYLSLSFFALALVLSGAFAFAPQSAEASCSMNGYLHSGGKCDKSIKNGKWEKKWHDDEDDEDDDDDEYTRGHGHGYWHKPAVPYYSYNTDALQRYINELIALIERLKAIENGQGNTGGDIRVSTQSATDIDDDRAVLRALIDMENEDEGELFFEYGTSYSNLSKDSDTVSLDEGDDGDILEEEITGLEDDTRYYFRAVVEDEDGDTRYGAILSFITDDNGNSSNDDAPDATTLGAQNIDTDSADLRGEIDMNDYENGRAFFVYGEDESQIDDVEDEYDSYSDVDEDNDDLRKVEVDGDVDGTESYTKNVADLDGNTDIFFALCVEYDDDDTDETLVCGSTKNFETD